MLNRRVLGGFIVVAMVLAAALPAAAVDIPLRNWSAPATWTPPASGGGRTGLALTQGPALPFIPVTPCRVVDTRGLGQIAPFGTPTIPAGGTRTFPIPTHTVCSGVPTTVFAYSLNVAVTNTGSGAGGYLQLWPTGQPQPTSANLNYPGPGSTLSNAVIVAAGTSGSINVFSGNASADVIIDINGYYSYDVTNSLFRTFPVITNTGPYAIYGSDAAANTVGVWGNAPSGASARGVYGTSGAGFGVYGQSTSNNGVIGASSGAGIAGVLGQNSNNANGTHGVGGFVSGTGTVFGVQGQISSSGGDGSAGVHGIGASATGKSYAVLGETSDTTANSAAVEGKITGGGAMTPDPSTLGGWIPSGLRGEGSNTGIWGFGNTFGMVARAYTTGGVLAGGGFVGYNAGTTVYGVYGEVGTAGTTRWAVYAAGNMGSSGTKPFIEPHPTQAGVVIRYVALEGPEAGTYFRGRGRFVGRQAVIDVPEDFRLVTDGEGLTIQVTPIGDLSQVAVVSMGLDTIELKSSRDVEFFYHVNGVRKTFKDWKVMVPGNEFMPAGQNAKMPGGLSDEQKRSLIRNGTYNEDGTPNMTTARRLGWDAEWASRSTPDSQQKN